MRFDLFTIFPHILDSYVHESILGRAQKMGLVEFHAHDLRRYTNDKHRTTDEKPYGGGAGMVMMVEPIYKALLDISQYKIVTTQRGIRHAKSQRIILLSAKGKQFTQQRAYELSRYKQIIFIAGRYEGVDERVATYLADEELSIGPYVLTGGELPAIVIMDTIARLIPGVLGNEESLTEESFSMGSSPSSLGKLGTTAGAAFSSRIKDLEKMREYPHYTRPEIFKPKRGVEWKVPKVLLSGDHKKIAEWREKHLS